MSRLGVKINISVSRSRFFPSCFRVFQSLAKRCYLLVVCTVCRACARCGCAKISRIKALDWDVSVWVREHITKFIIGRQHRWAFIRMFAYDNANLHVSGRHFLLILLFVDSVMQIWQNFLHVFIKSDSKKVSSSNFDHFIGLFSIFTPSIEIMCQTPSCGVMTTTKQTTLFILKNMKDCTIPYHSDCNLSCDYIISK